MNPDPTGVAATNQPSQGPLRRQGWPILLICAFTLLIGVVAAAGLLVLENRETGVNVLRSQRITGELRDLLAQLLAAETGQRGYFLTGDPGYLEPYKESIGKITATVERVAELTLDNPVQQQNVPRLRELIASKLAELANTIAVYDGGDRASAMAIVQNDSGRHAMDSIRDTIAEMTAEAERRLAQRIRSWTVNGDWLFAMLFAAVALVTLLTILTLARMREFLRALEAAQARLRDANDTLEQRVRDRTAAIQEANDEIQKFAYVVSHDLRAPLVNIMGFTNELDMIRAEYGALFAVDPGNPPESARPLKLIESDFAGSLSFIKQSTVKMDSLINAVLKLARSGRRQFNYEPLAMGAIIEGIVDTLQHQAAAHNAEVVVENLPTLTSDRLAIEQIFGNLLDNALKYLEADRPGRVVVRGVALRESVRIDVEDNGRGIAPTDLDRIFDLFRRAGTQDKPGEGIGLAHIKTLIRRLGGRISCRSELGKGTTFSVWLPQGSTMQ